jgi:sugar lactone lactonase YvrE
MGTAAGGYLGDTNLATQACMNFPQYGGYDAKGNLYVTDTNGDRVRRIAPNGKIYTAAGVGQLGYNGENIPANTTAMGFPRGLAVDAAGDFWYADPGNNRVRKVTQGTGTGTVATVAGNGTRGYTGDNGPATSAEVNQPSGVALDASGNLFFTDSGNQVVREINAATGIITTVVGNGTQGYSGDGGPATSASLNNPKGLAFDPATGNLYIVDSFNYRVRVVTGVGTGSATITLFAGNGTAKTIGDGGLATAAAIGVPRNVLVSNGTVYLSQAGISRVRQINITSGVIMPVAGSVNGYDGEGNPPASAEFQAPTGMMLDASGNLLIIDSGNDRVRKISSVAASRIALSTTTVKTIAGGYVGDGGSPLNACLNSPENISFDSSNNYLIADTGRVRSVAAGGTGISTLAGTGVFGYTGDNGPANVATMTFPRGVVKDPSGNSYIADNANFAIRKVDTSGTITTFWTDPSVIDLTSLAVDASGNIYSADGGACVIREITQGGVATIVAGVLNSCGYTSDGIAATAAEINTPYGIAVDAAGNLYIGDSTNNRVRMVTISTGLISTLAGTGPCTFTGDGGVATAATLCNPSGVAVDPTGRVFIADYQNFRVRMIEGGKISTYAGTGIPGYNNNNRKATLTNLGGPVAVGLDSSNVMYVADDVNYRIRVIQ